MQVGLSPRNKLLNEGLYPRLCPPYKRIRYRALPSVHNGRGRQGSFKRRAKVRQKGKLDRQSYLCRPRFAHLCEFYSAKYINMRHRASNN